MKKRRHFDKNAVREASDSEDSASEYSSNESDYDLNRDGYLRTILLKSIKKQDKLLNTIVKKQDELGLKLNGVNERMNKLDKTLTEQANSLEFVHNEVSKMKRNQSSADSSHPELAAIVDSLRLHTAQLEGKLNKQHKQAEYKAMDLEARSRRSNLIFHGLTETTDENCDCQLCCVSLSKMN